MDEKLIKQHLGKLYDYTQMKCFKVPNGSFVYYPSSKSEFSVQGQEMILGLVDVSINFSPLFNVVLKSDIQFNIVINSLDLCFVINGKTRYYLFKNYKNYKTDKLKMNK